MSKQLDILMLIYKAKTSIFTEESARGVKTVEDIIFKHKEFPEWCKRMYKNATDDSAGCVCVS